MDPSINELTERIIGCCYKVHKTLGPGFLEKLYENALIIELEKIGLQAQQQAPMSVTYDGKRIGEYFADILVEGKVVCELKAGVSIAKEHEIQLVSYLAATGLDVGLVINFGRSVTVRRKFREYRLPQKKENE
jgi:GxxExxY protein